MTAISTALLLWPGTFWAAMAVLASVAWLIYRVASRPRPFRWSDHRSVLTEFTRGGRR